MKKRVSTKARDLALAAYEAIRANQKAHDGPAQIERASWSTEAPALVRLRLDDGTVILCRPVSVETGPSKAERATQMASANLTEAIENGALRSVLSKGRHRLRKQEIDDVLSRAAEGKPTGSLEVSDSGRLRRCLRAANWPAPLIDFLIYRRVN